MLLYQSSQKTAVNKTSKIGETRFYTYADVAESADALDSGSSESNFMGVQVTSSAPTAALQSESFAVLLCLYIGAPIPCLRFQSRFFLVPACGIHWVDIPLHF